MHIAAKACNTIKLKDNAKFCKNNRQKIWQKRKKCITLHRNCETRLPNAKIAQLVEHDLAKVGVAGSSPVFRSKTLLHSADHVRVVELVDTLL